MPEAKPFGREIRPGTDDKIVRWHGCPDCGGSGWLCSNPFAAFNKRYHQCTTCEVAYAAAHQPDSTGATP